MTYPWPHLSFWHNEWPDLRARLAAEEAKGLVLPPASRRFAALELTPPEAVCVVILGQDPYPTPGHANGLAFSVEPDVTPLPRSLGNIYKELEDDLGVRPATGDLSGWAAKGVLLLNTALSVRAGEAGSHAKIGWDRLIAEVVDDLAGRDRIAWVLWGKHAQKFRPRIEAGEGAERLIIESAHPSPLSARRGFFGSKVFSQVETFLVERVFVQSA